MLYKWGCPLLTLAAKGEGGVRKNLIFANSGEVGSTKSKELVDNC
jgi:hypothetical protein